MAFRILIIGMGPAGLASSIFLAQNGYKVFAVDKSSQRRLRIGESLPPDSVKVLRDLGVWEDFLAGPHLPCYQNQSAWGSSEIHHTDFLTHPEGKGWHLDRLAFENLLEKKARSTGANLFWGVQIKSADRLKKGWKVKWKQGNETSEQNFDFIVDASGRASWFARRQGVDRLYEDQQLALVAFLEGEKQLSGSASLVETIPEGWWYSAPLPGNRIATALFSEPEAIERGKWRQANDWWRLLRSANHTWSRLAEVKAQWVEEPKFVSAESGLLSRIVGDGWLAVGDAALTYDPISSHGIQMGLVGAREASKAISEAFSGNPNGFVKYEQLMFRSYERYNALRQELYGAEKRFLGSRYWSLRQFD